MTRMPQVRPMPRGLTWLIVPDADGNLVLCLAPGLSCQQRKEALRVYERACAQRPGGIGRATIAGTAAIVAIVGIVAALLAFAPASPPQRLRPTGSVSVAPVRHHARRREDGTPYPRPTPRYVP
jgi:hypothetical protein